MTYFDFKNDKLYCEDVAVNTIAEEVGTPTWIYSAAALNDHYQQLEAALAPIDHIICYSVKANSNTAILKMFADQGCGFDIVSSGELYRVNQAGADLSKVVFAGVSKTEAEVREAIESDILFFSVESVQELERINLVATELGKQARFAIRVNPDVDPKTHKNITTGKLENKFGLDVEQALTAYQASLQMEYAQAVGLQMHIGSQLVDHEPYVQALQKITPLIERIRALGIELKYLDIGGGLGVTYKDETPSTAQEFANDILPLVQPLNLTLIIEPGRFITANAGILLTQVQYLKENPLKRFVMVDAGMTELMRPALYSSYHEIIATEKKDGTFTADIAGPICESTDCLAFGREVPAVAQGDYLAVLSAGAYGASMSSNYNSKLRGAEVLVSGDQCHVIRKRENNEDLIRNEQIPAFLK